MATLLENQTIENKIADKAAELHNAQIKERYRRLQDAEADQFAAETYVQEHAQTNYAVRASVLAPEAPAVEQVPQVTEFVHTRIDSHVFTTEKFEQAELQTIQAQAPVATYIPVEMPVQTPTTAVAVSQETQYSLSRFAKTVMAAFAAVVIVMLTLICVNSQIIRQKTARIATLETQKQELIEGNAEIQRRIQAAQSDEAIEEYALSQGMIRG